MPNIVDTVKRSHRAPMLLLYLCHTCRRPLFILLIWHAATAKAKVLTTLQIMMNPKLWQQWLWSCRLKRLINIFGRHPANYMCVSSWLHFAFIKVCPGLSWSRVNDLISNLLIFCIFIILMRWWACSHGRPKTFPIRIWYSLSIGELWVGLCSLLQHLNEFWVLLCLSYGPIISFFFKQYISEMSLLQTNIDKNCILHFDPLFSVQLLVEASTWKTNIELLPHIKDHMQFKSSVQQKPKNAYSIMPKVFCDIDTPYSMSDRHDHYCIKGIHLFTEICFQI